MIVSVSSTAAAISFALPKITTSASPIEYFFEYLETNRFPGESQARLLRDYLKQKYKDKAIDIVVANSDTSLDFFLKYSDELFTQTPIVFVAAKNRSQGAPGHARITGIVNINAFKENLELALTLHPSTKQVFVVSGNVEHDKKFETLARQDLQSFADRIKFVYLTDLSPEELIARTKSLPENSIILHVWQHWANERGQVTESPDLLLALAISSGFGADKKLFSDDDPTTPLPQGYSLMRIQKNGTITFERTAALSMSLFEPEGIPSPDFSQQRILESYNSLMFCQSATPIRSSRR